MKKNILILACLVTVLVSCQKDDVGTNSTLTAVENNKQGNTSSVDASRNRFTKRVIVEEFVGTSYGDAPELERVLNIASMTSSEKIIIASHHNNDIMATFQAASLVNNLSNSGNNIYPSSLIDRTSVNGGRFIDCTNAKKIIRQQLMQAPICGIALSSKIINNNISIEVGEGFIAPVNSLCNLTVYMVEENIAINSPAYFQANNFNSTANSPFFNMGNPMPSYIHKHVVRACITPSMGIPIKTSALIPGGIDHQVFNIELPSYVNKNNCYFIAFVSRCSNGVAVDVLNAQVAKLGTSVPWN